LPALPAAQPFAGGIGLPSVGNTAPEVAASAGKCRAVLRLGLDPASLRAPAKSAPWLPKFNELSDRPELTCAGSVTAGAREMGIAGFMTLK
jgi:hypothetical protein